MVAVLSVHAVSGTYVVLSTSQTLPDKAIGHTMAAAISPGHHGVVPAALKAWVQPRLQSRQKECSQILKTRAKLFAPAQEEIGMTFVIAEPCVDVLDKACLNVCPVACIEFEEGLDRKL